MYQAPVRSTTANSGRTVLAIVAILSLLLSLFAIARPVIATEPPGGGNADCPAGTTFVVNFNQADIDVDDELIPGVVVTAVTESGGELTSVTIRNDTDGNITIAVKGGSDQVGNSVTIAPDGTATISVTNNPTISNLSVCEGPEIPDSPTLSVAKVTVGGDSDFQFTLDTVNAALLSNGESDEIATAAAEYDIAEVLSEAQIEAGWSVTGIECEGNAAAETAVLAEGTVSVTVGADEDVLCTFTNTLTPPPPPDGELEVDKFNCVGEDDDTIFHVFGPFAALTEPDTSDCTIGAGVTFSVYTDAGGGVAGDFVLSDVTNAEGIIEVDLPAGDYVLVEAASGQEGPSQAFTIESGAVTAIVVLNVEGDDDEGEVKILKFVCPGEEDSVVFYEEGDPTIPNLEDCEVGEATFTIDGGEPFTTENGGALKTVAADVEHTLAETLPNQGSMTFTVGDGDRVTIIVINFEGEDGETPGSVTINKELDCDVCETFTPGYYFNGNEQTPGYADATRLLEENGPIVIGEWTFASVEDVRDQAEPGSLLRHTLALQLNVWLAQEGECDLASLMFTSDGNEFDGMTVGQILAAALEILESNDPELAESGSGGFGDLHEAIDLINNNHGADDGVLSCDATSGGAGFMFELYGPDDDTVLADSGTTGTDGSLVLDGDPDGTGLPLGTYTLVEVGNDADLECLIVDVDGEGATLDEENGTVTIVLTVETPDVTITVVNDCDEGTGGFPTPSLFSVSCPPGGESGPSQIQIEAAALEGLRLFLDGEEQTYDGNGVLEVEPDTYDWVITEADGTTVLASGIVDVTECGITVNPPPPGGGTPNEGEEGGNPPTGGGEGTQGGNPLPNTATSPIPAGSFPAALVALLMLAGLGAAGYAVRTEVARRR